MEAKFETINEEIMIPLSHQPATFGCVQCWTGLQ